MGLTVGEALALGSLKDARVLAGTGGLNRKIQHVTVVDTPGAADWLRGGEFVLTSAYAVKDTPEGQVDLIKRLIAKEAAALGIKLRRFIDALSDEALACAEEADFPIIELPFELAWADIITPVLDEVLDRQAEVLQRSIGVHTQFIHTVLRGGGMPDIAATLSEQIRAPVAIVDNRWTILASAGSLNDACPNRDMSWSEFIGMLRAAMLKKEQVKFTSREWGVASDAMRMQISPASQDSKIPPHSLITVPIGAEGSSYGRLIVIEVEDRLFSDMDAIAIGHAVTTATVEALRLKTAEDVERRFRVNFWDDLVHQRFDSQIDAVNKAKAFGVDLTCPNIVIAISPDPDVRGGTSDNLLLAPEFVRLQDDIVHAISRLSLSRAGGSLVAFPYRNGVSVVVPWRGDREDALSARSEAIQIATRLHNYLGKEFAPKTVSVGIGRYYQDPMAISMSYREASQSFTLGRSIFGPNSITHFDSIGIYRILLHGANHEELNDFVTCQLGVIAAYDSDHNTDLLTTLEVYLREGCNAKATADKLFLHVNTVKYRLARIQNLAGIDLQEPETRFNLVLALKIRRYLKTALD